MKGGGEGEMMESTNLPRETERERKGKERNREDDQGEKDRLMVKRIEGRDEGDLD